MTAGAVLIPLIGVRLHGWLDELVALVYLLGVALLWLRRIMNKDKDLTAPPRSELSVYLENVPFPLSAAPMLDLVRQGQQTVAGFTVGKYFFFFGARDAPSTKRPYRSSNRT